MTRKAKKERKPWQPKLESEPGFNPFASPAAHLEDREPPVLEQELAEEFEAAEEKQEADKAPEAERPQSQGSPAPIKK
jgi:hypothetical protein